MGNTAKFSQKKRRHARISEEKARVPSLRFHKASGQMYVVLSGKTVYCGKQGDPAAEQNYHRAIAEWLAAGRQLPADQDGITVKELLARFWVHAEGYYRHETDGRVKELEQFTLALRPLKEMYEFSRAIDFGPRALKAVQQRMVQMGWSRIYINKQINRVRHVFKWAVSDELIPGSVLHALQAVSGLKRGRTDAIELERVKPVPIKLVDGIERYVSRQVWTMIKLQLLTGARAGEICQMRPCDINRDGEVWVYKPQSHKTAHHGFDRKIFIGPQAQRYLTPFLLRDPQAYCFSPAEAEAERYRRLHENRVTYLSCGNVPGSNRNPDRPRVIGDRYDTTTYRRAIKRGCDHAFPPPAPLVQQEDESTAKWKKRLTAEQKAELSVWRKAHRWHPHQLRHNAATELRKEFGIDAARIILGHQSAAITEVYAEKDEQQAMAAMLKVG